MDEILHAHDAELAQTFLDQLVIGQWNALLVDLAVSTLVDQFADCLQVGVTVGYVRFDDLEHFKSGFCQTDEDAIVDLEEAEKLKDFARFWGDLIDTTKQYLLMIGFKARTM